MSTEATSDDPVTMHCNSWIYSQSLSTPAKPRLFFLQKYPREGDHPFASNLYRTTKYTFDKFRSHIYAKEEKKQSASTSGAHRSGNQHQSSGNRNQLQWNRINNGSRNKTGKNEPGS